MDKPSERIATFFAGHPTLFKMVLVINHFFRTAGMVGLMFIPGIPKPAAWTICVVGSVVYRLTVERNCAYKFALPALAGAVAVMLFLPTLRALMHHTAFTSPARGLCSVLSCVAVALYVTYVIIAVHGEVNRQRHQTPCCRSEEARATGGEQQSRL